MTPFFLWTYLLFALVLLVNLLIAMFNSMYEEVSFTRNRAAQMAIARDETSISS